MILHPTPEEAFVLAEQDFESFLDTYPQVPAWQQALASILTAFPNLTNTGRSQAAGLCAGAAKALSASQENSVSLNRVPVWKYLWGLKQATKEAYIALQVGQLSPVVPDPSVAVGLSVAQSASSALAVLQNWHPSMPLALQGVAPGNIPGLLGAIAQGVTLTGENPQTTAPAGSFTSHILVPGDTLRSLAASYLGDPSLWTEIQALNLLRYPYISSDLQDQYGPPEAEWILQTVQVGTSPTLLQAQPVTAGATTAVLPGPEIASGNVIVFSQAGTYVQEAATVQSVSGSTVTFASPVQNSYPAGSRAYLCPIPQNQVYQVLGYGMAIKIPVASQTQSAVAPSAVAPPDLSIGTDIAVDQDGYLYLTSTGDIAVIGGIANLQQAIVNRINTAVGSLSLWPQYGSNVLGLVGQNPDSAVLMLDIAATLLQDPRIQSVENAALTVVGPTAVSPSASTRYTANIVLAGYESSQVNISVPLPS